MIFINKYVKFKGRSVFKMSMYTRTEAVVGASAVEKLKNKKIIVFGVGGVGGYIVEALARTGVGTIGVVDSDTVEESNINRQLVATNLTIGRLKTDIIKERVLSINPQAVVEEYPFLYLEDTADRIDLSRYDYVIDAVDNVTAKLLLVEKCKALNVPIICSMGTGNKLHPEMFEVSDIYKTSVCPLAKVMRTECKKRGIKKLKVVYSKEIPVKTGSRTPGSMPFVPGAAGLIIAGEVIRDLIDEKE